MKNKILFAGAAGFVGSNFVRNLLHDNKKYSVVSVDHVDYPACLHNIYYNTSNSFHLTNINNSYAMNNIMVMHQPNIIVNLLSSGNLINDISSVDNMLKLCKKFNAKFMHFSPCSIYKPTEGNITEECILEPYSYKDIYNLCKENLIINFCKRNDIKYNIIRHSELFGIRQKPSNNFSIAYIINSFIKNKNVVIQNKGMIKRNLLNIIDLYTSFVKVLENGDNNFIYNVSSGCDFSEIEIAHFIKERLGYKDLEILFKDNIYNDDFYYNLDTTKIRKLGWAPVKFKDRLYQTVDWYKNNIWFLNR